MRLRACLFPLALSVAYAGGSSGGKATTYFTWATAAACPIYSGGLSGGDVFLILFFVGGFLYLAIGMVYKYKVKEQSVHYL